STLYSAYDCVSLLYFFFSSRRRHTSSKRDWSSDVCSSDLTRLSIRPSAERQQQITVFKQKYATMEKTSTDTHTRLVLRKLYGLSVAKVDSIVTEMLNPPTADS